MSDTDGATYDPAHDRKRLVTLRDRILNLMLDGAWRTLEEIRARCGGSETGCSAKLRDLRKDKHGGYKVDAQRLGAGRCGTWQYRLVPRLELEQKNLFDLETGPHWR